MEDCETSDENNANSEKEDLIEDSLDEPVVALKEGLDLARLREGQIFEFDIDVDKEAPTEKESSYFDDEELLNNLNVEDTFGNDDEDDETEPFESLKKKMAPIASGIFKRVKRGGHGIVVPEKAFVTIHYNNYLEYSDDPFDSTRLRNIPCKFILDSGAVIPGLDICVASMKTGELSQFLIPPEYAFGALGVPPRIPPDATVLCEVELLRFVESADFSDFSQMTEHEKTKATFHMKLNSCKTKHKMGNSYFNDKMHRKAIEQYRWAIKVMENATLANEEEERLQQDLLAKLHLNLSQCFLVLSVPRSAKMHAKRVLDLRPGDTKAHFRLGKALSMEGEYGVARKHLHAALRREPHNNTIAEELRKVDRMEWKVREMEKQFCRSMFGQKDRQLPGPPAQTTAEFRASMAESLANFLNDDGLTELPFYRGFSPSEIACIKELGKEMGLAIWESGQGSDNAVKISKKDVADQQ